MMFTLPFSHMLSIGPQEVLDALARLGEKVRVLRQGPIALGRQAVDPARRALCIDAIPGGLDPTPPLHVSQGAVHDAGVHALHAKLSQSFQKRISVRRPVMEEQQQGGFEDANPPAKSTPAPSAAATARQDASVTRSSQ